MESLSMILLEPGLTFLKVVLLSRLRSQNEQLSISMKTVHSSAPNKAIKLAPFGRRTLASPRIVVELSFL